MKKKKILKKKDRYCRISQSADKTERVFSFWIINVSILGDLKRKYGEVKD